MSLSRSSFVRLTAAVALLSLFACKPAADRTDTVTTQTTATSAVMATTETSSTDTAATATSGTGVLKYGPGNPPPGESQNWGKNDTQVVKVKFDAKGNATATPDPGEVNANQTSNPGKPGTITWQGDPGVAFTVHIEKSGSGPACIQGPDLECQETCTANVNPAIYHSQQAPWSARCSVVITKKNGAKGTDPDIVIDNCCP